MTFDIEKAIILAETLEEYMKKYRFKSRNLEELLVKLKAERIPPEPKPQVWEWHQALYKSGCFHSYEDSDCVLESEDDSAVKIIKLRYSTDKGIEEIKECE